MTRCSLMWNKLFLHRWARACVWMDFKSLIQVKSTVLPCLQIKQCEVIRKKKVYNSNKISVTLHFSQHASTGERYSRKSLHRTRSSAVTWHCGWEQSFVHLLSSSSGVICLSFLSPPVVWDATYLPHCQEKNNHARPCFWSYGEDMFHCHQAACK